jgi:hypothetical protein
MADNLTQNQIITQVWKAIAQSELDVSSIDRADLEKLVGLITNTVLVEVDKSIGKLEEGDEDAASEYYPATTDDSDEKVLWQGRPFLSITEHYVITNQRVRFIRGLLGKKKKDVELVRIQDLGQTQTFRERTLNLGDITIYSHDRSDPVLVLNNVREPEQVHEILRQAVMDARKRSNITFQEEM